MNNITYKYIEYTDEKFEEVIDLRFEILFKPYNKIAKYEFDEIDNVSFHLVAIDENKVVGYSRMTNFKDDGKITNVVVSPKYLRKGIGHEMLKRHIVKANDEDMNFLYLNSRLDTINFYRKIGFECEGFTFISDKSGLMLQKMIYKIN